MEFTSKSCSNLQRRNSRSSIIRDVNMTISDV